MKVNIFGGGLAGCEAAYQLLKRNIDVVMYECKSIEKSPVHTMDTLCELVCSNSLKSNEISTSSGLLKQELRLLDSLIIACADSVAVPAGGALAVDRHQLSQTVTERLLRFDNFTLVHAIADEFLHEEQDCSIVATGPLTHSKMIPALEAVFGKEFLYFFDAVAPIITADSIDFDSAFVASRYNKGSADYINCPMNKEQYLEFYDQLINAQCVEVKDFENNVFEGCMPIEIMAKRGLETMRFGPLKPVGLYDARYPNIRPYAVVQLRKENIDATLYNLVGFQTHLKFGEQQRVFSMIPALANADFVRYGVMHRNTYINAPKYLDNCFALKQNNRICFAGQLTGVEGYVESVASGLVAGVQLFRRISGLIPVNIDNTTMIGALSSHISTDFGEYKPMNSNFGILKPLSDNIRDKSQKKLMYAKRSLDTIQIIANIIN